MNSIPYGYCHCGCGQKTRIATSSAPDFERVKGEPNRFIVGHAARKYPQTYKIEDRGHQTPCWIWQGSKDKLGYGRLSVPGDRKVWLAHRFYYERKYGAVLGDLDLDHLCRVPSCCNPDHVEPVTHQENCQRGEAGKHMLISHETAEAVLKLVKELDGTGVRGGVPTRAIAKHTGTSRAFVDKVSHYVRHGGSPPPSLR